MASSSSNSTNVSPMPIGVTTSGLDQVSSRFSQKFITGKVIRLQAHVYVFVCSHCDAEFRSPNSFLQHCELHYLSTPMMMPYYPPNYPSNSFSEQISPQSNHVSTGFGSATMPSLPSLPPFNSYNNNSSSSYCRQSRHLPQYNPMAYNNNQPLIAPRQTIGSSWSDCCSPIGDAQARSSQSTIQSNVIDHQHQIQPTAEQSDFAGIGTDVTEVPDDEIYEIYDLGFDPSSAVTESGEPKKKKRSKSKMGPYICEFCSKSYNRLASLKRHYQSIHNHTSTQSKPKSTASN